MVKKARGQRFAFTLDDGVVAHASIGDVVYFSLKTADTATARARHGRAAAQFEQICEAVRRGPQPLTKKQQVAFSGLLYHAFASGLEEDPGDPELWAAVKEANDAAMAGELPFNSLRIPPLPPSEARKAAMEKRFGALVDLFLRREAIITDAANRRSLIEEAAKALNDAVVKLKRNAEGDYRPDPIAERFPAWEKPQTGGSPRKKRGTGTLTFQDIFDRWRNEGDLAPSTITTWGSYWRQLKAFVKHDEPARVVKADIVAWKDALLAAGRTAKSIRDGQLAAARTLFNYALANDLVSVNPVLGVMLRQKAKAGQKKLPYTDEEVARLLELADQEKTPYRHWLPWLMALSGARAAEVAQMWGKHIIQVDGVWVMQITATEDGGRLKNAGSEREVPIHPAVLERGFLDFVEAKGSGPLFYGAAKGQRRGRRGKADDDTDGRRHASKGVTNRLGGWIRSQEGFNDPRKSPNHAFRHWFKTACMKAGIHPNMADALQGHAGRGEAAGYEHPTAPMMAEAIAKIAVPTVRGRR